MTLRKLVPVNYAQELRASILGSQEVPEPPRTSQNAPERPKNAKIMDFRPAEHVPPVERHNFMMISGRKSVTKRTQKRFLELPLSVSFAKFRDESNGNDENARNGQNDVKNDKKTKRTKSDIFEKIENRPII